MENDETPKTETLASYLSGLVAAVDAAWESEDHPNTARGRERLGNAISELVAEWPWSDGDQQLAPGPVALLHRIDPEGLISATPEVWATADQAVAAHPEATWTQDSGAGSWTGHGMLDDPLPGHEPRPSGDIYAVDLYDVQGHQAPGGPSTVYWQGTTPETYRNPEAIDLADLPRGWYRQDFRRPADDALVREHPLFHGPFPTYAQACGLMLYPGMVLAWVGPWPSE